MIDGLTVPVILLNFILSGGKVQKTRMKKSDKKMKNELKSPRITNFSWGRLVVDDRTSFKDAKLFPGGSRKWDWKETGTDHVPGIKPADVKELLDHGAKVVVLSKGIYNSLGVRPDTIEMLKKKGVYVHVFQTDEAIRLYNELRESEAVGGLFHTTC